MELVSGIVNGGRFLEALVVTDCDAESVINHEFMDCVVINLEFF